MHAEFQVSEQEFVAVAVRMQKFRHRLNIRWRRVERICAVLLVLMCLANIWYFPRDFLTYLLPVLLVASPFSYKAVIPINLKRQYREDPELGERRILDVDSAGIRFANAHSSVFVDWTLFSGFAEEAECFLLRDTREVLIPIPKRQLGPKQAAELRAILEAHMARL